MITPALSRTAPIHNYAEHLRRLGGTYSSPRELLRCLGLELRDYQWDGHHAVMAALARGLRRVLIVLPTGAGKTVVFGSIIARGCVAGRRMLVLAHRKELIDQAAERLRELLGHDTVGVVRADEDDADAQVVVASVQTIKNPKRLARVGSFNLIVIDEAHHSVADSYRFVLDQLGALDDDPHAPRVLGVTATPDRGDGEGLADLYEDIVYEIGILPLIEQGYLADIIAKRVMLDVNLDTVSRRGGDFADGALGKAMADARAPEHIAQAVSQYAADRVCLIFVPTVEMAHATAGAITAAGIRAEAVDGRTPDERRAQIVEDLRDGTLRAVVNCGVFTEGTDLPIVDCVVIARPTCSRALYQQMAGRGLRQHPGKIDCLILDMVGATQKHTIEGAASLLGDALQGGEIREGETATQAVKRHQEEQATQQKGRLVAFDVSLFERSDLSWVTSPGGHMVMPGYSARSDVRGFAIRQTAPDRCEVYQLREAGHDYRAKRMLRGLPTRFAVKRAEQMAKAAAIDVGARKDSIWRNQPVSDGQRKKLWALGYRNPKRLNAIKSKGEAANLITAIQADRAIAQLLAQSAAVA